LEYKQRSDFITYWLHQLHRKKYVTIQFLEQEVYENYAILNISPKPDKIWRIFMIFKNIDTFNNDCKLNFNDINNINENSKINIEKYDFSVVEWGGLNLLS
jgi:hypothetical protein